MDQPEAREGVGVVQTAQDLAADVDRERDRERPPDLGAAIPHVSEITALDRLHRDVELTVDLPGRADVDDVVVVEPDDQARFVEETGSGSRDRADSRAAA